MSTTYNTIALVGRPNTPGLIEHLLDLAAFLKDEGFHPVIDDDSAEGRRIDFPTVTRQYLGEVADVVIVLGGDGTMLSLGREIAPYQKPLIGINQGRLGFMTDIPLQYMKEGVMRVLNGEHIEEQRMLLEGSVLRDRKTIFSGLALNDVVFSRGMMGSMIEFEVFVDKQFVYSQRSDGLIVSTPTGSTAYSLASGGPILHPTLSAIALVPICPQSMSNRPIVINDTSTVEYMLTRGHNTMAHFDGHLHTTIHELDRVVIRRYEHTLRILHPLNYNYYDTLRHKLHWGERLI